jgi:hypothetical protein
MDAQDDDGLSCCLRSKPRGAALLTELRRVERRKDAMVDVRDRQSGSSE